MNIDLLSLLESLERAVERAESALRRHARPLAALAATACLGLLLLRPPSISPTASRTSRSSAPNGARDMAGRPSTDRLGTTAGSASPAPAAIPHATSPADGAAATHRAVPPSPPVAIYVHVAGEVERPGVVRLRAGARAFEAVRAAGGLRAAADLTAVNLAARVRDEGFLIVPRRGESPPLAPQADLGGTPPTRESGSAPETRDVAGARASDDAPAGTGAHAPNRDIASSPSTGWETKGSGGRTARKRSLTDLTRSPLRLNEADAAALEQVPGIGPGLARAIVGTRARLGRFSRVEDLLRVPRIGPRLLARIRPCLVVGGTVAPRPAPRTSGAEGGRP